MKPTRQRHVGHEDRLGDKDVSLFLSDPVIVGDTLFGLYRRQGQFFALDAHTGKVLWLSQPIASIRRGREAGSLLLLLNDDGKLIVTRRERSSNR